MKQIHVQMSEFYDVTGTDSTPRTITTKVHKSHMTAVIESLGASVNLKQIRACSGGKTITVPGFHGPVIISPSF